MNTKSINNIHTLDGKVPLLKSIPYGLQHVLAMFVANITPILIVAAACKLSPEETANLIQTAMIIAGVGSLIQIFPIFKIGSRLPVIMGISATFISIFCYIGPQYGYGTIIGCVIVCGILEGTLGLFAKYWRKIISPIVAACVVTAIGFSLLPIAADSFGGGSSSESFGSVSNWILGSVSLVSCLLFNIISKKRFKQLSVLFGLLIGYIVALALNAVDFSGFKNIGIISIPEFMPVKPVFNPYAILSVFLIFLVSATETIGDTSALTSSVLDREPTTKEISGSLACDGFISSLSALFGCLPITSFSQNVGLISMTKVINRHTIATGAVIMIIGGIFPVVGAFLTTLPQAVLGGCSIMMFGSIAISGFEMIGKCGYTPRNITIASLSLSVGLGFTQMPELFNIFPEILKNVFAQNCVAVVFLISIILNLVLPKETN